MPSWLFPVPLFARAHLLRAVGLWLGARLMLALQMLLSDPDPPDLVHLPADAPFYVVAVTTVLGLIDTRMRREVVFLATLGISRTRVAATFAAMAVVLELAVRLTGRP